MPKGDPCKHCKAEVGHEKFCPLTPENQAQDRKAGVHIAAVGKVTIAGYPRLAHLPILARNGFVIERAPVSLNRTYAARAVQDKNDPTKHKAFMYSTGDAKAFADDVAGAAKIAVRLQGWPADLWTVEHVRLSVYPFNTKSDAAAGNKVIADALEGVYYVNDRAVSWGEAPRPVWETTADGTPGPRLEFIVDLLTQRTPREARTIEIEHYGREIITARKKRDHVREHIATAARDAARRALQRLAL